MARIHVFKALGFLGALGSGVLMSACMGDAGLDASAEVGSGAILRGQVTGAGGAAAKTALDGELALVTTHEVDVNGNVGPVVDSVRADANGSFELRTRLRGEKALIVLAARHGAQWRARVEDRLEAGKEKAVGILDAKSSVDAEVWLALRASSEGRAVASADIRGAVEAYADSLGLEGYQGNQEARSLLVARVVLMAKARAALRAAAILTIIARADSADTSGDGRDFPRADLTPCERAVFLVAAMNADHPDYASLRAGLMVHCFDQDTVPPAPPVCADMKTRLEGLDSSSAIALGLRLRLAAFCTADVPPPQPLTRCERAAVRLTLMDTDRGSYTALKTVFTKQCLESENPDDEELDEAVQDQEASAEAGLNVRAGIRIGG